mgnify:CR=1 FL=1|jgi:hypothetical protein
MFHIYLIYTAKKQLYKKLLSLIIYVTVLGIAISFQIHYYSFALYLCIILVILLNRFLLNSRYSVF